MLNSGFVKRFGVNTASILLTATLVCLAIISTAETSRAQKDGRTPAAPGLGLTSNKVERVGRAADNMYIRSETHIGCRVERYSYESQKTYDCIDDGPEPGFDIMIPQFVKLPEKSKGFVDLPRAASKFVADEDDTLVAITFSAMGFVSSTEDDRLLIRVLVDGQEAAPGQITLTGGRDSVVISSSNSFTFLAQVDAGIHTVQVQYSTELISGHSSYIRNASLKISTGLPSRESEGLTGKWGEGTKKGDGKWTAIPGATHTFYLPADGEAAITFSSVLKMTDGDFILVRAVVDGGIYEIYPVEAQMAGRMYHTEARSITFNAEELPSGAHVVEFEWRSSITDVVAVAEMYEWTIVVKTEVNDSDDRFFDVVSQNNFETSGEDWYKPLANLSTKVSVDEVSDIAVTFSGELAGLGLIFVAPTINGHPVTDQEVILYYPTLTCADPACGSPQASDSGAASYTFGLKNVMPSDEPYEIGVAYRVLQAGVSTPGSGLISGSNLVVEQKKRVGPDLAVGPNMGRGSKKYEWILEPVYGERDLLTVIIDPNGGVNSKFKEEVDDSINAGAASVKDYYLVVSGGRLEIQKAATLGTYEAEHAGEVTDDEGYYENSDNFDCEAGAEFKGGADALHAEALLSADAEFDFGQYDKNNDGRIDPSELAIIVGIARDSNGGSSVATPFKPYCDGTPFVVDGVEITELVHLNLIYQDGGLTDEQKTENMMVAAHELGHHILGLDDLYARYKGVYDGVNFTPLLEFQSDCPDDLGPGEDCQNRYMNTAPQLITLMTYKTGYYTTTTHIDGFHKLQLGWVTPYVLEKKKEYKLKDVKKSEDVYILPRRNDDGREYVLLESRFEESQIDDPLYDYNINDDGLAVYHVIEPGPTCQAPLGAGAPDCKPLIPPACVAEGIWYHKQASNFARLGLRLIQPDVAHVFDKDANDSGNDYAEFKELLFGTWAGAELLDEGTLECTDNIGDPLPAGSQPLLRWVDGSKSGYSLLGITTSGGDTTKFNLVLD